MYALNSHSLSQYSFLENNKDFHSVMKILNHDSFNLNFFSAENLVYCWQRNKQLLKRYILFIQLNHLASLSSIFTAEDSNNRSFGAGCGYPEHN